MPSRNKVHTYRTGALRRTFPINAIDDAKYDVSLVFVPEIGHLGSATSWSPNPILFDKISVQVLEFDYVWHDRGHSVWQDLIIRSDELLACLKNPENSHRVEDSCTLLIGHGLGGTIIKQCINVLAQNYYDPGFAKLKQSIRGLILLGTPHLTSTSLQQWQKLCLLLKKATSISEEGLEKAQIDVDIIRYNSRRFEDFSSAGLTTISGYECRKTTVGHRLFRNQKQILVDEAFARTMVPMETMIRCDADHFTVHRISPGTTLFVKLKQMLMDPKSLSPMESQGRSLSWESSKSDVPSMHATPTGPTWGTTESSVPQATSSQEAWMSTLHHIPMVMAQQFDDPHFALNILCFLIGSKLRNTNFIGRDDIMQLLDDNLLPRPQFQKGLDVPFRSCTLYGLGGVGKSEIALQYAFSRKDRFDAIFFVEMDHASKVDEGLSAIAKGLGLVDSTEWTNFVVSRSILLAWLSNPIKKSFRAAQNQKTGEESALATWLLILDGVPDPEILLDVMGPDYNGSVLITSRDPTVRHVLTSDIGLLVDPMGPLDGSALLQRHAYPVVVEEEKAICHQIVQALGGHPLAIASSAKTIIQYQLTYSEFLEHLERKELFSIRDSNLVALPTLGSSIASPWRIDHLDPRALFLLQMLSIVASPSFDETLVTHIKSFEQLSRQSPLSTKTDYLIARSELIRASLITRSRKAYMVTVHKVVQEYVRQQMTPARLSSVFACVVDLLAPSLTNQKISDQEHVVPPLENTAGKARYGQALRLVFDQYKPSLPIRHFESYLKLLCFPASNHLEQSQFGKCAEIALGMIEAYFMAHKEHARTVSNEQEAESKRSIDEHSKTLMGHEEDPQMIKIQSVFNVLASTDFTFGIALEDKHAEQTDQASESLGITSQTCMLATSFWSLGLCICHAWALIGLDRSLEILPLMRSLLKWRAQNAASDGADTFLTANILQILGVVQEKHNMLDCAFTTFQLAHMMFCAADADEARSANQVRVKLGEHYSRLQQPESAREMYDQALLHFGKSSFYEPEIARTLFKKSQLLGRAGDGIEADKVRAEAERLFAKLKPGEKFDSGGLGAEDFDGLVVVMSR